MKKTYINPEMEVVQLNAQTLLADSLKTDGNTNQNLADEYYDFENEEYEDELGW